MKEEGIPFNTVMDSALETANVMKTPSTMNMVSSRADRRESEAPPDTPTKNMDMMAMRVGNAPPSKRQLCSIRRVDG